ncbi:MAG: hypothetical protein ABIH82_03475 [Candidatus Woesearchaeota archaeon]
MVLIIRLLKRRKHYYPLVPINETGREIYLQGKLAVLKSQLNSQKYKVVADENSKIELERKAQLLKELITKKKELLKRKKELLEKDKAYQLKQFSKEIAQRKFNRQVRMLELDPYKEKKPLILRERLTRRLNFLKSLITAKKKVFR